MVTDQKMFNNKTDSDIHVHCLFFSNRHNSYYDNIGAPLNRRENAEMIFLRVSKPSPRKARTLPKRQNIAVGSIMTV